MGDINATLDQMAEWLSGSEVGSKAIEELRWLVARASATGRLELDVTLARGLNYYTGCIFEVQALDVAMGSVGGGGRYDNLTGIFGVPGLSGVGISFGLDRIVLCLEELGLLPDLASGPQAMVFQFSEAESDFAFQVAEALRAAGVRTVLYPEPSKIKKQFDYAEKIGAVYAVMAGAQEQATQSIQVKNMRTGEQLSLALADLAGFAW
jgi:histidyl-tRNA synthetase